MLFIGESVTNVLERIFLWNYVSVQPAKWAKLQYYTDQLPLPWTILQIAQLNHSFMFCNLAYIQNTVDSLYVK